MSELKFCKDCKWCVPVCIDTLFGTDTLYTKMSRCFNPKISVEDFTLYADYLVTGLVTDSTFASVVRTHVCKGDWWESK